MHGPQAFRQPSPNRTWAATLTSAQVAVERGHYAVADSALADFAEGHVGTPEAAESDYWRGVFALDPRNPQQSGAAAVEALDAYFATAAPRVHDTEAGVLRRTAQLLASLQTATQTATSTADAARTQADSIRVDANSARVARASRERSEDEAVQRLRDSLDKVVTQLTATTQELERIKKRLGTPPP